jgi:hypothetical protein
MGLLRRPGAATAIGLGGASPLYVREGASTASLHRCGAGAGDLNLTRSIHNEMRLEQEHGRNDSACLGMTKDPK